MFDAKLGITLTSALLLLAAGCQQAEPPSSETSGAVDESAESIENAEPEASSSQERVAAKVSPPTVEATPETPTADSELLTIGDPAPPLSIATWVTGEPVKSFESGQVYVVEFWATWCGPCKTSMPHLSQLNEEYGEEVQMIGVTRESAGTVEEFLAEEQSEGKTWRDVVTYRLAEDANDATSAAYMEAAGQNGIPTAFIVGRDGIIEWIGHPMTMEQPLASVVAGDYDRSAALAEFQQQQRVKQTYSQLGQHLRAEEWDKALEILATLENDIGPSSQLLTVKHSILTRAGRVEEAAALQSQIVEAAWDDSRVLNQIAWNITAGDGPKDLELALKAARQASELTSHENAAILDTLARVHYEMGNLQEAIAWQEKAVKHGKSLEGLQETLEKYQAEKSAAASPDDAAKDTGKSSEQGKASEQDESSDQE